MLIGSQVRAARAMMKLTVADLAKLAQVAPNTIVRVEADKSVNTATLRVIQQALEGLGVEFIPENGGGAGVRLKKRGAPAATAPTSGPEVHPQVGGGAVGPEDEDRAGPEAPATWPSCDSRNGVE